jgi:two-component system OmpR family sensor kinase
VPIRVRLTLVFMFATVLLLSGGGWLYLRGLDSGLDSSLDTSLRARAVALQADVAARDIAALDEGGSGALLPVADTVAQVLTASGHVVANSPGLPDRSLLSAAQLKKAAVQAITFDAGVQATPRDSKDPDVFLERLLGAPAGRDGLIVVTGTSREVVDDALQRATQQLLVFGVFVLLLGASGAYLLARAALRPVELMRAQAADLTAQDAGESLQVPKTRDEVSRLALTINELLGRLHAALARERAFVADAGHELRTPLTVLKGELELASRPGRTQKQLAGAVAIATAETDRLIRLSEDLLLLAQADGPPFLRLAPVELLDLLRESTDALRNQAAERDVTLCLVCGSAEVISADAIRLRQALDNLLVNAIRFSPEGGLVQVSMERVSSSGREVVRISVSDQGPGFAVDFLPVAFERFRRAEPARIHEGSTGDSLPSSGSGLGLAIVRSIVLAHGGSVGARNQPSGGGLVSFDLPVLGDVVAMPLKCLR